MSAATSTSTVTGPTDNDPDYEILSNHIRSSISGASLAFTTNATPEALWAAYHDNIPEAKRQHYNCHCCRHFIMRFGGLVTIDDDGKQSSLLWNILAPIPFFQQSIKALRALVERAEVNGVFLSSDKVLGTPQTGEWRHLSGTLTKTHTSRIQTAHQAMAEHLEEFKMLQTGLAEYPAAIVDQALGLLRSDALYRSEKSLGAGEWFAGLHKKLSAVKGKTRNNIVWKAVATAPTGFCHIRTLVINTLLDDIKNGLDFKVISRRWSEKLHPLQYQRPTAAPTDGAIDAAEKLVEKLGVMESLKRRYATLADVLVKLWVPVLVPPVNGTFGHLRQNSKTTTKPLNVPVVEMTWNKFSRTVLPNVISMEILVPQSGPFYGLVTASNPDAPPILAWDGLDGHPRNPVSWFFYHGGSTARDWNLFGGIWAKVNAVFLPPHAWQGEFTNQAMMAHFAIDGCHDKKRSAGLALFPETLKADLHGIRKVVEAHSNKSAIDASNVGDAHGLAFQQSSKSTKFTLRLKTAVGVETVIIDRWE